MEKRNREFWLIFLGILVVSLLGMGAGITCPILFLTGISCPGCGMTRAWCALLRGEISLAFSYHPLFPLPLLILLLWPFRRRIPGPVRSVLAWAGVVLVLAVWLVRFWVPGDPAVRFDPSSGWLWRTLFD